MSTLRRGLALSVLAVLTACGGGGSGSNPVVTTPATTGSSGAASAASSGAATAKLTLRFPSHVAKAKITTAAQKRKPGYINPNGGSLVITIGGNTVLDPVLQNPYFSLGTQDLSTGTSTITVPLTPGFYPTGNLLVTEYDGNSGCCTPLAYGYNAAYTDINGNYQDGSFSLGSGGTAAPVVTMAMNTTGIAFTSDPVNGSDAVVLSTNGGAPTNFNGCWNSGTVFYAFPTDANGTFVLPSSSAGYTGGDPNSYFPGVPTVTLANQYDYATGQQQVKFLPGVIAGSFKYVDPQVLYQNVFGTFQVNNPISNVSPPFGYNYYIYGYVVVGDSSC